MSTTSREPGADASAAEPVADGRKQRWAAHREARRDELVDAAVAAIRRLGPATGMDDIAAEAGVTKPVVYRYFADKADLYVAVGQRAAEQLMSDVLGAIDRSNDPKAMLTAAVDAYLAQIESSPNLYLFVVTKPHAERGPDLAHDYQSLIAAGVARSMGRALREAGLDSGGAEAWAHGSWASSAPPATGGSSGRRCRARTSPTTWCRCCGAGCCRCTSRPSATTPPARAAACACWAGPDGPYAPPRAHPLQ